MSKTNARPDAAATLKKLQAKDAGLKRLLEKAYGYAVFPSVGKANLVVGGSYGRGEVFEKGKRVGYATITQLTIGVQVGGDTFSEVVVFENKEALDRFKRGVTRFAANASAVLVKAGAASAKNFEQGAAVFIYTEGGMMLELGIGGQRFRFKPAKEQEHGKKQGDQAAKSQSKAASRQGGQGKGAKARGGEDDQGQEAEQDEREGEEQEEGAGEDGALELAGRAVGGVRGAASKATAMIKRHPVAAVIAGVGLATGVALLVARTVRGGGAGEEGEDADSDADTEEQDEGAQGSADDYSEEDSAEDQSDEGEDEVDAEDEGAQASDDADDDEGDEGEEEEDDADDGGNRGVLSRLLSRGKSRA